MAGLTDFAENAIQNALYRGVAFPTLTNNYWALFTTLPLEDGSGAVEPTAATYARVAVPCTTGNYKDPAVATQGDIQNSIKIVWPVFNVASANILGFGWYDAPTGGNVWFFIDSPDVAVDALGQPYVEINGLTHSLT